MSALPMFARLRLRLALFTLLGWMVGWAAPGWAAPAKPTSISVQLTRNTLPAYGTPKHTYLVTWQDNALDETGYRIQARFGNLGSWSTLASLAANSTSFLFPLDTTAAPVGTIIQFRVTVFKYNGSKVETSTSSIGQYVLKNGDGGAGGNLNAPSQLTARWLNDGQLELNWKDNASNEIYYQIFYKKEGDSSYTHLGYRYFNTTKVAFQPGLAPGSRYHFKVRATRRDTNTAETQEAGYESAFSNVANMVDANGSIIHTGVVVVPGLAAPTNLTGSVVNQHQIRLEWKDNSFNETGYLIEYSTGEDVWESLGTTGANSTSLVYSMGPGRTLEWRVRAVYQAEGITDITSEPSPESVTLNTSFPGPTNLIAETSGRAGTIKLTWQDQSDSETYYDVYARPVGASEWNYAWEMVGNSVRVEVDSYAEQSSGTAIPFQAGAEYEFMVQARFYNASISPPSNTASAYAQHGFTCRPYQPAQVGKVFGDVLSGSGDDAVYGYQLSVSNADARVGWSVANLPPGLSFDEVSGVISGTPTQAGVYVCPMEVTYSNSPPAQMNLTLRVLEEALAPVVATEMNDVVLGVNTGLIVSLDDKFDDPDAETAVKLRTTKGDIDLILYSELTEHAVANFLSYVDKGYYNGVAFHRLVPGFILQGGGYTPISTPNYFSTVETLPSPINEPGISNLRGTVASAKVGGSPDSATHDFFINLSDSNPENLDNQNGGFTAFGRVAGTGMTLVDTIASLPIGVYSSKVVVDGSTASFTEIPMDVEGTNAPAEMDVNQTVRIIQAARTPVLTYSVTANSDPDVVRTTVSGGYLLMEGLTAGVSTLTVTATDLDGSMISQTFDVEVLTGFKPPVITRQPVSVVVAEGGKTKFSVTATGTNLSYQWFRNGAEVPEATANVLNLTDVTAEQEGEYEVRVSNSMASVVSNKVSLNLRTAPTFDLHPVSKFVDVGKPLELEIEAKGHPAPSIKWLRGGKAVSGQKKAKLNLPSATLKHAGVYTASISNAAGKATSQPATVVVVDKGYKLTSFKPGKKVTLKAQAAGPGMAFQWRRDGVLLDADEEHLSGTQTATLVVSNLQLGDNGREFSCDITVPGLGTRTTGAWRLLSYGPSLTESNYVADIAYVGVDYDYTLPGGGESNNTISSFSLSKLPSGLKYDKKTGRVTGRPTKPGVATVKLKVSNPAGSASAKVTFMVMPLPEPTVGSYVAEVAPSEAINGGKGGKLEFTATDRGAISGSLTMGKTVYRFKGSMIQNPNTGQTLGQATIARKGKTPLELSLLTYSSASLTVFGVVQAGDVIGTLYEGNNAVNILGYRRAYNSTYLPAPFAGKYNLGLSLSAEDNEELEDDEVPKGDGYLTATVKASGAVSCAGRLSDGTKVTLGGHLGSQGQFMLYQSLYKHTGVFVGTPMIGMINLSPNAASLLLRVEGVLRWQKDAQTAAKERNYKEGFGPVDVKLLGTNYKHTKGKVVLNLPDVQTGGSNARLIFEGGGLDGASKNPNVPTVRITSSNSIVLPTASDPDHPNLANVKLKVNADSGTMSGSFELDDDGVKRTASFTGLLIPRIPVTPQLNYSDDTMMSAEIPGVDATGVGYFQLAKLPSAEDGTTLSTSPLLSGSVRLKPAPINILTQPVSAAVNPGGIVGFSVVAESIPLKDGSLLPLSYQWRKDGVSISGATETSYTINGVVDSNAGNYDVVISSSASQVISATAVLTVNKPVSDIVITREPGTTKVAIGSEVTFTAAANGTMPFTYQWYWNSDPIEGANDVSYTIPIADVSHSGAYSVRVGNVASQPGEMSGSVSLWVVEGVSNPMVARTVPAPELDVFYGAQVTLMASANGEGPFSYQWYFGEDENLSEINGATQETYSFFAATTQSGYYRVKVMSEATPEGVMSDPLIVPVRTEVSNVVASRTGGSTVSLGEAITFSVTAQGEPELSFQWQRDTGEGFMNIPDAIYADYSISVTENDAGRYRVLVSNGATPDGVYSNEVELVIGGLGGE